MSSSLKACIRRFMMVAELFAVSVILQNRYESCLVDADEASHTALTDTAFAVACHTVTGDALEGGRFVVEQRVRGGMTRVA